MLNNIFKFYFRPILELFKEIITICVETLNDIMRKTDDGIYTE